MAAPTTSFEMLVVSHSHKKQCSTDAATAEADDFVIGTYHPHGDSAAADDGNAAEQQCCLQAFDPSMVAKGLSQLGRSASGAHQVYQRLQITHTNLDNPQHIAHCQHIQQLLLANNCLTTLQPLAQLQHLTSLDASNNRLTKALDYSRSSSSNTISSRLRRVDLSHNNIDSLGDLRPHSNLLELNLSSNRLLQTGSSLQPLNKLRRLDLSNNNMSSCHGLQGLCSLQELVLDGNRISSLHPLGGLSGLQVLTAAHNCITALDDIEGLSSLRRLDVAGNQLRRIEVLAACRGRTMLTSLNVSGNPLEAAQDARLHIVHLLTQLQQLNSVEVTVVNKVDASNMVGGATDGLVQIRRRFFPAGELSDGGGAVPPTAAGLKASQGEEERCCADPAATLFEAVDRWAASVQPALALQPVFAAAATAAGSAPCLAGMTAAGRTTSLPALGQPLAQHSASSSRRTSTTTTSSSRPSSNDCRLRSRQQSAAAKACVSTAPPGGIIAIAARLAAGCCPEAPYRQLQLLRVCWAWVLAHVQLPHDCDVGAGSDLVTSDVGRCLFVDSTQHNMRLQEALLPDYSGTWAECVSQLLVSLLRACHMEAQQLSGFWKAGGAAGGEPGQQLASHNHSWVAAKVNGKWRLLDPVYSLIMARHDLPLPFFLPPEAFIHTHLPFEPCWQLLPDPVRTADWWRRPGLSLGFAAAGGQLLQASMPEGDGGALTPLKACNVLEVDREALALPTLKVSLAAPASSQQHLVISILDSNRQPLPAAASLLPQQQCSSSGSSSSKCAQGGGMTFQQRVLLGASGVLQTQQAAVGPEGVQGAEVHQLWAALPDLGSYFVKVEQVTEVPGGLLSAVKVEGLRQPLSLALRQHQEVLQVKVVVQATAQAESGTAAASILHHTPAVGYLPQWLHANYSHLQLVAPQPGTYLEADRAHDFVVVGPAGVSVAVGSEQSGWVVLKQQQRQQQSEAASGQPTSASASSDKQPWVAFSGSVMLPRVPTCYVAIQDCSSSSDGGWVPVLGLHVWPPVHTLVAATQPVEAGAPETVHGGTTAAAALLAALDVDGDGRASRRDMLLAFRRDRQLADHLKMPAKIRAGPDGTFDAFVSRFILVNSSGLGYVSLQELNTYLASLSTSSRHHSSSSRVPTAQHGCV